MQEEFEERGWQPPKATPDMTRAAKNLIDSWQLEDFDCRDVLNPGDFGSCASYMVNNGKCDSKHKSIYSYPAASIELS